MFIVFQVIIFFIGLVLVNDNYTVSQNKESYTGLDWHYDEQIKT